MMNLFEQSHANNEERSIRNPNFRSAAGVTFILAGAALFIDRYLQTGWLSYLVLPCVGLFLYLYGIRMHHKGLILVGGLLGGIGVGSAVAFIPTMQPQSRLTQVGLISGYLGIGWLLVVATIAASNHRQSVRGGGQVENVPYWALVPSGILLALGCSLLYSPMRWTDFVLFLSLGVGLPLLIWGLSARLFGLVIPGCLLLGIGPGIHIAWSNPGDGGGLSETGVMLVFFALGWLFITICARWFNHKNIWWPLIPGGIIAVVGTGLYIGGNPENAVVFIGNTGSIALMIFGLYLLLMRKGIHH